MVQPKTPPLSIRIPAEMLAMIDAMAERRGLKRHAAILWALAQGIAADLEMTPKRMESIAKALAKFPPREPPQTMTELMARERSERPRFTGTTALGEPLSAPAFVSRPKPGKSKP